MKILMLLSVFTLLALPIESAAQAAGAESSGAAGRREPGVEMLTRDTLSPSDLKQLAEKIEQWKRVDGKRGVPSRVARSRTAAMLAVMKVPCGVLDAAYRGTALDDAEQHVYEAACEDGMGYLLMLKHSELTGASCLEAARENSPVKCMLPANADSKVVAAAVLARSHIECTVRDLKWLGSNAANLDHIEVACESSGGYVVRSPRPGSGGKLEVFGCQDASKQGVACELSPSAHAANESGANARPTLEWFKQALGQNGVSCESKRARIVGRESIKRRYLVEFECGDRPEGLVVFVPPAGDTVNPFESMDCPAAAQRGVRCELLSAPPTTE